MPKMTVYPLMLLLSAFSVLPAYSANPSTFKIINSSDLGLELEFQIGDIESAEIQTEEGAFTALSIPGGYLSRDVGTPALPTCRYLFGMPYGANPVVKVVDVVQEDVPLSKFGPDHPVYPVQPSYSKSAKPEEMYFRINHGDYKRATFNQDPIAEVEKRGTMRGVGVGALVLAPIQYNPSTKMLRIFRKYRVTVEFQSGHKSATDIRNKEYSPAFKGAVSMFLNASAVSPEPTTAKAWAGHPDFVAYPITYLVVASDQLQGNPKLVEFIEWKKQKGFKVIENYVSSTQTITQIDAWIEAQYAALSVKPSFLLIVGDESGTYSVPAEVDPAIGVITAGSWYVTRSDLLYGVIGAVSAGNHIPSIHVGRFSVQSLADLTNQVNKTIWYEKGQFEVPTPDLAYLMRPVGAAGSDASYATPYGNPQIRYGWYHYFNAANGMTNAVYYLDPDAATNDTQIVNLCSAGVNFYNYTAHGAETLFGDPSFSIANVNALTNLNRYPLVVGNCCLTASFGTTECFGEAWLNRANGGAIGYIGASMSTSWAEDLTMGTGANLVNNTNPPLDQTKPGMYDGRMMKEYQTQAAMKFVGLLAVENYGGYRNQYWSAYHLLGDPSLTVYFGIPPVMTVTHQSTIPPGATNFTVSVPGVTNALCAVYDAATKTLHGAGVTDSSGNANIIFTQAGPSTGNMNLTVTSIQKRPYIATVPVMGSLFNFQLSAAEVNESAGSATFYVTRGGQGNEAASVDYICSNVTATVGSDYTMTTGRLNYAVGVFTNSITVPIIDDATDESSEKFRIHIYNPLPGVTAMLGASPACEVTILDNEGAGELCFTTNAVAFNEASAPATVQVTVRRINGSVGAASVQFSTVNGTATVASGDYAQTNGTLNLGSGVTSGTVNVSILADTLDEPDETFTLSLYNPTGATLVAPTSTVVTIQDNDVGGTIAFATAGASVRNAAQAVPLTLQRSGGSDGAVSIGYTTVAGTAAAGSDFVQSTGVVYFAHGQTSAGFNVQVMNASLSQPVESFWVALRSPSAGVSLGAPTSAVVSICSPDVVLYEPMDVDPGWTCQGLWAFGRPAGQSGDPTAGSSGLNVYGYNLNGAYEDGIPATYLTTPEFDCSSYSNLTLSFYRWLGVESSAYDGACVQISNNGSTWTTLWTNAATMTETAWTKITTNISSVADGKGAVRLRWVMGATDSSVTYSGWNIDDVVITGKCYATANQTPYSWLASYNLTNNYESADLTDQDGDGLMAWEEYRAGTNPTNAASVFEVLTTTYSSSSNCITWYGSTNSGMTNAFVVLRTTNLTNGAWIPVGTNARAPSGVNTWWDRNPPVGVPVYYRPSVP